MELDPTAHEGGTAIGLAELWKVFGTIGISSFGGGLSGWIYRELVERHKWISPDEFLVGLALARAAPGPNVVNLAIWIGYRLRGTAGAVVAACSVLAGPLVVIIVCATVYARVRHSIALHQILLGVTAAALGLSLSVGFKSLRAAVRTPFYAVIALTTFVGVGILHQPMLPIVVVLASISVAWSFLVDNADEG
jgi:chromate transporter